MATDPLGIPSIADPKAPGTTSAKLEPPSRATPRHERFHCATQQRQDLETTKCRTIAMSSLLDVSCQARSRRFPQHLSDLSLVAPGAIRQTAGMCTIWILETSRFPTYGPFSPNDSPARLTNTQLVPPVQVGVSNNEGYLIAFSINNSKRLWISCNAQFRTMKGRSMLASRLKTSEDPDLQGAE